MKQYHYSLGRETRTFELTVDVRSEYERSRFTLLLTPPLQYGESLVRRCGSVKLYARWNII